MSIRVNIPGFSEYFIKGIKTAEVNGSTVSECLKHLVEQFPKLKIFDKDGRLFADLGIYVNGGYVFPEKLDKPVKDRDEISIILMFIGG